MSIFDDEIPDPAPPRRSSKAAKNPFADPEQRLEPQIQSHSDLDHDLELDGEDFVPMDSGRNRHLSRSLDSIRDDGPATRHSKPATSQQPAAQQTSAPSNEQLKGQTKEQVNNPFATTAPPASESVNNPFASATAHTKPVPTPPQQQAKTRPPEARQPKYQRPKDQPTRNNPTKPTDSQRRRDYQPAPQQNSQKPEKAAQSAPPPPEFARRSQASNSLASLTLWTLLAMAVLLAGWSTTRLSSMDTQLANLTNKVNAISRQQGTASAPLSSPTAEPRMARLENNIQALEDQLNSLEKQPKGNQTPAQDNVKLAQLEQKIDGLQKELKATTDAAEKAAAAQKAAAAKQAVAATKEPDSAKANTTTKKAAVPAEKKWVINIASLSNRANAIKLADKAKALGTDTRVESFPSQGRTLYRIRAYGYASQKAAEKSAEHLQAKLDLSGMVVRKI